MGRCRPSTTKNRGLTCQQPRGAGHGDADATAPLATAATRIPPLAEVRPDLSRGLIEAVQQALAHDPGARQDSVGEFRAQLGDGQSPPFVSSFDELVNALLDPLGRGRWHKAAADLLQRLDG